MQMNRFRDLGLEEGGIERATLDTLLTVVREWWKQNWRTSRVVHTYFLFACLYLFTLSIRPTHVVEVRIRPQPSAIAPLYHSMPSTRVLRKDAHYETTLDDMAFVMAEHNYTCLAAIHVGVPLNVFMLMDEVFINAKIHSQGTIISKAREQSAFFPLKRDVVVTRYIPVTIAYDKGLLYSSRNAAEAHCILHMIDQMDGRTIFD